MAPPRAAMLLTLRTQQAADAQHPLATAHMFDVRWWCPTTVCCYCAQSHDTLNSIVLVSSSKRALHMCPKSYPMCMPHWPPHSPHSLSLGSHTYHSQQQCVLHRANTHSKPQHANRFFLFAYFLTMKLHCACQQPRPPHTSKQLTCLRKWGLRCACRCSRPGQPP